MPSSVASIGVLAMAVGALNIILGALVWMSLSESGAGTVTVVIIASAGVAAIGYGLLKGMRLAWFAAMAYFTFEVITRLGSLFGTKVVTWELLWIYVWTGELVKPVERAVMDTIADWVYWIVAVKVASVFLYSLFRPNALEYFRKEESEPIPSTSFGPAERSKT
jgi:hypothetical protein